MANFMVHGLVGTRTDRNKLNSHGLMVHLLDDPLVGMRMEKYQKLEITNREKCMVNG